MKVQLGQNEVNVELQIEGRSRKGRKRYVDAAKDLYSIVTLKERNCLIREIVREHFGCFKTQDLCKIANALIIHQISIDDTAHK